MTATSNFSEDYFKKYRVTKDKLKTLLDEIAEAETKIKVLRNDAQNLRNEIVNMRQTITLMIDNGWDPVEAKLKQDCDLFPITLWDPIQ